jgi:hypothetical protein
MNLDDNTDYPKGVDLLILPFQGRSDIHSYVLSFIDRLLPRKILLYHYDDTFPPLTSPVKTEPFISLMCKKYPDIPVLCPKASAEWIETAAYHEGMETSVHSEQDKRQHLVGRVGKPEDIAEMVLFLCSDKAGFVTGEDITIDGGMSRLMIYHNDHGWSMK